MRYTLVWFGLVKGERKKNLYLTYLRNAIIPDLAVEVIFSSGSVEDLEKYQKLGVKEVWFWINNQLEIYVLVDDSYQKQNNSDNLADLNAKLLNKYISQVLTGNPRILKKAFLKEIS